MHSATEEILYGVGDFRLLETLEEFEFAQRTKAAMIFGTSIFGVRPHGGNM
jgi:hypothetical protein